MSVQSVEFVIDLTAGTSDPFNLPAAFTSTRVSVEYFDDGALESPAEPSAGTLLCETTDAWSDVGWRKMEDGRIDCTDVDDYIRPFVDYPARRIRFTPESIAGASWARVIVWQDDFMAADPIDRLVYLGQRALITQPYTEANVKNGVQFYLKVAWPGADPIPTETTRKLRFQTGAKTLVVKDRFVHYIANELQIQLYVNPTGVTGGVNINPSNYNRTGDAVASTVTVTKGVSTTDDGTPFDDEPDHFFGGGAEGQRDSHSIPRGRERIIPPNSDVIVAISNTGTGNARVEYFLDWYEGGTDLPRL